MVAAYIAELERVLSHARLSRYRPAGGDDIAMVVNYLWNSELSETFYHSLGALETALRNSIHATLTGVHRRPDWYATPGFLKPRQSEQVNGVKQRIEEAGKPILPGRVVAGLDFGFWTTLLSGGYGHLWSDNAHALIRQTFPNAPAHMQSRKQVHGRFNTTRLLRNRVFHYECIIDDQALTQKHLDIIDAIGWISPQLQSSVTYFDRFLDVYIHGRQRLEDKLKLHLRLV